MDNEHIMMLHHSMRVAHENGDHMQWCMGYVTAFQRTGLITNDELNTVIQIILDIYDK